MRLNIKRPLLAALHSVGELTRRFELHAAPVASYDVASPPFVPNPQTDPDHSLDTITYGACIYRQVRDVSSVNDPIGNLGYRKATIDVHPKYQAAFEKAYGIRIGGVPGMFDIISIQYDASAMTLKVFLQGR